MPTGLRFVRTNAAVSLALALTACASAPPALPEHTLFLGEVARIASRTDLLEGFRLGADRVPSPVSSLKRCGFDDDALQDRRFAVVRFHYYWHNVAAGVVHSAIRFAAVPPGMAVRSGNLVEVDVTAAPLDRQAQCATIHRVRSESLTSANCTYRRNERGGWGAAIGVLSPIGGPGSASIDCAEIEGTGWDLVPFGPYGARVWRKLPSTSG
jgi:hypothetical protein